MLQVRTTESGRMRRPALIASRPLLPTVIPTVAGGGARTTGRNASVGVATATDSSPSARRLPRPRSSATPLAVVLATVGLRRRSNSKGEDPLLPQQPVISSAVSQNPRFRAHHSPAQESLIEEMIDETLNARMITKSVRRARLRRARRLRFRRVLVWRRSSSEPGERQGWRPRSRRHDRYGSAPRRPCRSDGLSSRKRPVGLDSLASSIVRPAAGESPVQVTVFARFFRSAEIDPAAVGLRVVP